MNDIAAAIEEYVKFEDQGRSTMIGLDAQNVIPLTMYVMVTSAVGMSDDDSVPDDASVSCDASAGKIDPTPNRSFLALVTRFLHKPCINRAYMKVDCINEAFCLCRLGFSSRTVKYHFDEMTRGTLLLFYTCGVRIILYIYNVFTYGTKIPH